MLAIDEPTNHVDAKARNLLKKSLHTFSGIGLIVSHDRDLLDALCGHCLFLDPPSITVRPGGYTQGKQLALAEAEATKRQYTLKKQTLFKLNP